MPFEGSSYTVNGAMYEVISYGCGYTRIKNDEESCIFGGRQLEPAGFCSGLFYSEQWWTYLLFVYYEETNEPNEPLDAWWSVQVALHSITEFKPNFEFASIEVKLGKMTDFYVE